MIYVNTGDEKLDVMIKAISSRYNVSEQADIAVCAVGTTVPTYITRLIIVYSDSAYITGDLHKKYLLTFGERYVPLRLPLLIRELEEAFCTLLHSESHGNECRPTSYYNSETRTVAKNGKSVVLSAKEAELYLLLRENSGKTVSREELRNKLWENTDGTNAPDVYVSYLRRKLSKVLGDGALVNVRGAGYMLKEE